MFLVFVKLMNFNFFVFILSFKNCKIIFNLYKTDKFEIHVKYILAFSFLKFEITVFLS